MPSRTSVAQQSGVDPPQPAAPRHAMVSSAAHVGVQTGTSVVRLAQQVPEPGHGTVGQVGPASLAPPLLDPLLPPELPPLLPPLPPPDPPPDPPPLELPELLPDDEELPVPASIPEPTPGLLLLAQPAQHAADATTAAVVT
jgi:hypothetical protein